MNDKVYKIKLKKGDTVVVLSGKYKGQTGKITATHPTENKVTVEGINIVKKHIKPTRTSRIPPFEEGIPNHHVRRTGQQPSRRSSEQAMLPPNLTDRRHPRVRSREEQRRPQRVCPLQRVEFIPVREEGGGGV